MATTLGPRVSELLKSSAPQDQIFQVVLEAIQQAQQPRLLIIEDIHWADQATLDFIKFIGRRIPLLPTMLVLTLRSDEVDAASTLSRVIGDLPARATQRLSLQPLSLAGVAVLAGRSPDSAQELHRITGGNPFFVTELIASGDTSPGRVPDSIRDAVSARIARLPASHRELLGMMSIVPGRVEPWLLHVVLGAKIEPVIEDCIARQLVVRDDENNLRFRHELARTSILVELAPAVRMLWHDRVGKAMSEEAGRGRPVDLARRVHHASGAADARLVLELAPLAAATAARLGAHYQAAAHLRVALDYVSEASRPEAAQLYESWADEAGLAVGIDDAVVSARKIAVDLWRGLGRPEKVAHNLRWLSRLHWYRGEAVAARDYVSQAIETLAGLEPGPELAAVYSMRSQFHMLHDETDDAIDWGRRALALAERLGETETRIHALNNIASAMLLAGRPGGGDIMDESLSLALAHGYHEQAARAYTNYADYAVSFKSFALAERLFAEGIAFDTQHDLDSWTHYLIGRQAYMKVEQGRFQEALIIARGILAIERLTLIMRLPARIVLAKTAVCLGLPDRRDLLDAALRDALATDEQQYIGPVRLARVENAWLTGDLDEAARELDALAQLNLDGFDPWELGELAVWWQRCHIERPFPVPSPGLAPPRAVELAGDIQAAAAQWSELDLPYETALTLLQARGEQAGTAIAEAVEILEKLDAKATVQYARRLATQLGVANELPRLRRGPYAAARSHPLGLTAKEVAVLRLLGEGLSNQAIAQRLGRSPRTIEHHVSAILGKLSAETRMDVILRLHSEPWLLSPGRDEN